MVLVVTQVAGDDSHTQRIARVEDGLRPAVTIKGDPGWTIEERMEHYGVPGVGIAVIHDDHVAWFKTYGVSDRETGAPVKSDTLFQAGSVSKPVAAFGALKMVADGKLSLNGNVNDMLKSWKLPDNEFTKEKEVNLTHLLSHTGGLTVHGFPGYAVGESVPSLTQVLDGSGPANTDAIRVDTEPGSQWRYSGGGYTIAQQLMIDVTGKTFPELTKELVLEPLGMRRSTYQQPLPPELLKHAAAGYLPDKSAVEGKRHTYPEMAAAGLWTTAEELALFAIEVQQALRGKGKVLSKEMARKMVEEVDQGYGHGFGIERRDDDVYFTHGGWDAGFCANLRAHRDRGYGVAVMINSNHPAFIGEVIRAVAEQYDWGGYEVYDKLVVPETALGNYPGRYRYNAEQAFVVRREGKRLFMQYVGSTPEELLYVGDGRFMRRERQTAITFTEEDGESVFHFVLPSGEKQTHGRLADDERVPRELLLAGPYDEALEVYRAVLKKTPEESSVSEGYLNNQGLGLLDSGQTDEAIAVLRVATELYAASANTWDSLGYAYREKGDREQAIQYYKKALKLDPEFRSAVQALSELEAVGD
jgi:CubicO group peptidase (beta-lactamase class C family)